MRLSLRTTLAVSALAALILGSAWAVFAQSNSSYTVQARDILDSIAARYDVQTACLAKANDLGDGSKLKVGMVLTIDMSCPRYDGLDFVTNPREVNASTTTTSSTDAGQGGGGGAPSTDGTSYIVERGDTLDTIGQSLDKSVVAIQVANDIQAGDIIRPGQTLTIPADAPAYGLFPALTNAANPSSPDNDLGQGGGGPTIGPNDQAYVVQLHDTLDGIGARFDMQVTCLAQNNNITAANRIFPGETIVIVGSCPRYDGFDFVTNPRTDAATTTDLG